MTTTTLKCSSETGDRWQSLLICHMSIAHMVIIRNKMKPHLNLLCTKCNIFYLRMAKCAFYFYFYFYLFTRMTQARAPGVSFQKIELRKELSHYRIADEFVAELVIFTTTTFYTRPIKTLYAVQKSRRRRRRKSVFSRLWFHYIFISAKNRYCCQPASKQWKHKSHTKFI